MKIEDSKYFKSKEFKYAKMCPFLLEVLERLRIYTGQPVIITDSTREIKEHVRLYRVLSDKQMIKTKENGLSNKPLLDLIPWESKHLPKHYKENLEGVDIRCKNERNGYYTGVEISRIVEEILASKSFRDWVEKNWSHADANYEMGIGAGKYFAHLDSNRPRKAYWIYDY